MHAVVRTSLLWRSTRATRACCSAARTTTAACTTGNRRGSGRADLARLLPVADGGSSWYELARAGISARHLAVCGARAGPHGKRRRPGDRVGCPRPCLLRGRGLGRPGRHAEDLRRRLGRALPQPGRRGRCGFDQGRARVHGITRVAKGTSAPNLLGVFNDKTSIEADRTGTGCDGNVYFSWSRFNGNGADAIYFSRSTDHGVTFSSPMKLRERRSRMSSSRTSRSPTTATSTSRSARSPATDPRPTGSTWSSRPTAERRSPSRASSPLSSRTTRRTIGAGAGADPARSTTIRRRGRGGRGPVGHARVTAATSRTPAPRATRSSGATRRCAEPPTSGRGTRVGLPRLRRDQAGHGGTDRDHIRNDESAASGDRRGLSSSATTGRPARIPRPFLVDRQATGHQIFPDISADGGVLHAIWWDSRNDPCYSVTRPIGNCADRRTVPSLDVYGTTSADRGTTWTSRPRGSPTSRRTRTTSSSTTARCRSPATTCG